jgi:HK97 family phage prohead protease
MSDTPLPLGPYTAGTPRRPAVHRLELAAAALAPVPDLPPAAEAELTGLVVPYGATANRFGGPIVFEAGCLSLPADLSTVKLLIQHDDERPVGYATAAEDTPAGLRMSFRLADHPRAAELSAELAGKLRDGLSVGVEPSEATLTAIMARFWGEADDPDPIVFAGDLREVSAVSIPQFNDARAEIAAAAGALVTFTPSRTPERIPPMPATITADPPAPTADVTVTAGRVLDAPAPPTIAELAAAVSEHLGHAPARGTHPLARFASFAAYAAAAREDPRRQLALVDQITTDNPGLIQPAWLSEIIGIIDQGSPVASALTAGNLPPDGMSIYWPTYTGDYKTLVAKQATEKTPVHSAKVSIGQGGPAAIETFAGGSDISYQLLARSSPSYLDAYNSIMALAYAWTTEATVSTYLIDAVGAYQAYDIAAAAASDLKTALFAASAAVWTATGAPASHVFASLDQFGAMGGMENLQNAKYGTQNVAGTASAATLEVNVNGLEITPAPAFPPATIIVTNKQGARYLKDGPYTVTAEDVEKLGRDVAVWGMGAFLPLRPAGIVQLTTGGVPPAADDEGSGTTRKGSK